MADIVGRVVAFWSPRAAARREAWRIKHEALREMRGYDGARRDRLTSDWQATGSSPDAQLIPDLATLRQRCRQMCRDNPYAAAAKRNLVAQLVGPGIEARAQHADPKIAKLAQDAWRAWATSKVDGRNDFYGVQKLAVAGMIDGGETLLLWKPEGQRPDVRVQVLDGDYLNSALTWNFADAKGRVIAGVEFNQNGDRVAYNLFSRHPSDIVPATTLTSSRIDAAYVDHIFESKWAGQTRGEPWFHAGIRRLRDVGEIEEAQRIKRRVEACLAVLVSAATEEATDAGALGERKPDQNGRMLESLSPGMIANLPAGSKVEVVNPSSGGDVDAQLRGQLMAVAASLGLPYHMLTGDVSQANYSSLRAATVVFWALLDDWQWNTIVPQVCDPAFARCMRRAAMETGQRKLLEVTAEWTPPARPWVDPLKDITAEIMELRAFPGLMPKAYSKRGFDWRSTLADQYQFNKVQDVYGLASDADPRKVNKVGGLQPPAGFVIAKPEADAEAEQDHLSRAAELLIRAASAEAANENEAAELLTREAIGHLMRRAA